MGVDQNANSFENNFMSGLCTGINETLGISVMGGGSCNYVNSDPGWEEMVYIVASGGKYTPWHANLMTLTDTSRKFMYLLEFMLICSLIVIIPETYLLFRKIKL